MPPPGAVERCCEGPRHGIAQGSPPAVVCAGQRRAQCRGRRTATTPAGVKSLGGAPVPDSRCIDGGPGPGGRPSCGAGCLAFGAALGRALMPVPQGDFRIMKDQRGGEAPPPLPGPKGPSRKTRNLQLGKSDRAISATQTFGSQTLPPPNSKDALPPPPSPPNSKDAFPPLPPPKLKRRPPPPKLKRRPPPKLKRRLPPLHPPNSKDALLSLILRACGVSWPRPAAGDSPGDAAEHHQRVPHQPRSGAALGPLHSDRRALRLPGRVPGRTGIRRT